jgi:hypothetical protein
VAGQTLPEGMPCGFVGEHKYAVHDRKR